MGEFPDFANLSNQQLIDELYKKYSLDPLSVDLSWRHFFEGVDFVKRPSEGNSPILNLIDLYRRSGHLMAPVNPILGSVLFPKELQIPDLDLNALYPSFGFTPQKEAPLKEILASLQKVYGSRIGFEYMHLGNSEMESWIQERIEPDLKIELSTEEKRSILGQLNKSELLETFLHTKYVGKKRFSIEGAETLLPILAEIIDQGTELGMEEFVLAMAHRGRLNVLSNLLQKPFAVIFQEFEDILKPNSEESSIDVYYHKGFSADVKTRFGKPVHLHLCANSSCLESVDPIALGVTRAKQVMHDDEARKKTGAILMHGDAALSGQGVVYESLEFMRLEGYGTGGTIHIAINNQIGFTTVPLESRSTRYCTDIAKTFSCPVFHVNSEDPESCFFVAKLAIEFRLKFGIDVFIDLNCYRKYGHNEGDEPAFTQPEQYKIIRSKKSVRELYIEQLGEKALADEYESAFKKSLESALTLAKDATVEHSAEERFGNAWSHFKQPPPSALMEPCNTKVTKQLLETASNAYCTIPSDFHLHPKLQKWVEERHSMLSKEKAIDWGMAECLAFGTLLLEKISVRLSGQDCRRGTFSHRHAFWIDQENSQPYSPFSTIEGARFDVYNSPLSEFATLGFEYGYTWANPNALVIWEAQYGDFVIGAQTVIDHYITTAEQKWARYSAIVMLLPHGYEGGGPEHSSGRMERFLELAAQNNSQVACLTTPAQYFHILRRQVLRPIKKPLILFTPKSFLRSPDCLSSVEEFTDGSFEEVLVSDCKNPKRVLLCSGRIYFDLIAKKRDDVAIIRLEQLYPVHREKLQKAIARFKTCKDFIWVQDEPQNMGAWTFLEPILRSILPGIKYVGRESSAVTATGSMKKHIEEQNRLLHEAFDVR